MATRRNPTRTVILGAAGRDFHNFNMVYRDDPTTEVVAFTAAQIPDIAGRRYPPSLAGARYPGGIPIVEESQLEAFCATEDIERIVCAYRNRESSEKFSHLAQMSEIEENDYNLNIPRYVDTFEEEEPVDLTEVSEKLVALEKAMTETDKVIVGFCEELGIKAPF